jgi:PIN domain nuclease of toxin-antitoxin system
MRSDEHELFFSLASLWELSLKIRTGKLRTLTSSIAFLHDSLGEDNITLLPIRYEDLLAVEHLKMHHRDPFDRLLIAQAINHGLSLLTNDTEIKLYPVATVW